MPKISQLPTLETITTGSIIPVVENSITQKLSVGKLYEFLSGTLDQTFATEIELMLSASSLVTTSSFNAYTASANTSSLVTTSSFNSYTSSNDGKWNTLGGQTGSFVTEAETGSFVTNVSMFLSKSIFDTYTGSAANAVSSAINAATSSLSSSNAALDNIQLFTSSFNTFTSSVNSFSASVIATGSLINTFTSSINSFSASVRASGSIINTFTSSLNTFSASVIATGSIINTFTSSVNTTTASLNTFSASVNGKTGSFATTGSNTFTGNITMISSSNLILRGPGEDGFSGSGDIIWQDGNGSEMARLWKSADNHRLTVSFTGSHNSYIFGTLIHSINLAEFGDLYYVSKSSFNTFTSSNDSKVNSLINKTGSYATTSSLSSSGNIQISGHSIAITASDFAYPIIISANRIVFTGSVQVGTGGEGFHNYGTSKFFEDAFFYKEISSPTINKFLETSSFNTFTSSVNSTTQSLNNFTASVIATGSNINSFTASVNGKTGSFATTGSNTFIGNQTISGSLNITPTHTGSVQPSIGDSLEGGKVAYILTSSDTGYDPTLIKGIIVATTDQSTGIEWYNGAFTTTSATGTAIGTGLSNTDAIIASQGAVTTNYAAGLARAYGGGGYSDWYLPSKDELNQLYLNRVAIGGFASAFYWSSTEATQFFTWRQNLNTGVQDTLGKSGLMYVRAIRTFSIPALTVVALGGNTTISGSLTITGSVNISGSTNITQYLTVGGNIINSSTATSLTLDGENVTVTGDLSVGGNDIKSNIGTTAIRLSGSSVSMPGPVTVTGSLNVSGSFIVTGSARGNVVPITIVSSTASLDMTSGSYFTLTLANTTNTHIRATSITPGVNATLLITTGTNSSASLSSLLLQPSGSSYTASLGSGKKDVLSLVAFDSTNMYVVSTKAMQ